MNQLKRILVSTLVSLMVINFHLWSGTTGKIAGIVKDKKSGEPQPAVNIVVLGTSLGAVTDLDGEYTILQVPPGVYKVQFSFIGAKKVIVNDVRVFVDQTARVDVALEFEEIEMTETIILGERPIKLDVATSVVDISINEIKSLPAANVVDVIGMQAGIQGMSIRAGKDEQALFMLDGITLRDPRNNKPITKVALSSVKAISVERGGFNAEYGQVQAGVINVVTNEGKTKGYTANINLRMTPPASKYFRITGIPDVHDNNSYWLRPFFDPQVCWIGTTKGWDAYTQKEYVNFVGWNEVSKSLLSDTDPKNDLTPLGAQRAFEYETRKKMINNRHDYEIDAGFGGPVPFISEVLGNLRFFTSYRSTEEILLIPLSRPDYKDYDWRIVLNSDISKNMKLRLSGLVGNVETMEDNWNKGVYIRYPNEVAGVASTGGFEMVNVFCDFPYSLTDIAHKSLAAKLTHILSDKTFYEVSAEYFERKYHSRPPASRDTSILIEVLPGYFATSNPFGYFRGQDSRGIYLKEGVQISLARDNSIGSAFTFKGDITSQVDFNNLIKAGFEFVYNDLDLDYGFISYLGNVDTTYQSRVQMRNYPFRVGLYVQNKLETKGFTLNAGVRFDYSNSQSQWVSLDPYNQNFYLYYNTTHLVKIESKGQWQISPRLGISHPITEDSKLYFNYGHFKQMPQYEGLFRIDRRPDGSLARIGDPSLTLAKTISYELGYDHQLFDNELLIQLTAFYRDVSNLETTTRYFPITVGYDYYVTTSNGYQDVRGFEMTLKKSPGRWFYGFINYTYQASSNGHFNNSEWYEDPNKQVSEYDERPDKYYQTRSVPSPYARANLNFSTPEDFGPSVLNYNILGDFMVNLLLNWSQGGWTTYNPNNVAGVLNNLQYVDYFDGRLRVSKGVRIGSFSIQLFADVSNLFNTKRLRLSYSDLTKSGAYINSLHLPESDAYRGINIPGKDKIGDYREPGVEWQPMKYQHKVEGTGVSKDTRAIFYEGSTGRYWRAKDGGWVEVDKNEIDRINSTKAYIQMPNPSTFWFLNPRNITFGLNISIDFD